MRTMQFVPGLAGRGIEFVVEPFFRDEYLRSLYSGRRNVGAIYSGYFRRIGALLAHSRPDAVWLEKEALPWVPWMVEAQLLPRSIPLIADFDDAVFHRYDMHRSALVRRLLGRKIDGVMSRASLVLAGNDYLADRARSAGAKRVEVFPTVVDLERYRIERRVAHDRIIVGWIGSPNTARYLKPLEPVLRMISSDCPGEFVAIGARQDQLDDELMVAQPWSEDTEVEQLSDLDIGVMPLSDDPWERGKCGYKLIQYMASGLPVVASPVGVNSDIVSHGETGFLAVSEHDWADALTRLIRDAGLRRRMGQAGRIRAEKHYSLQVQTPRLERLLRSVLA